MTSSREFSPPDPAERDQAPQIPDSQPGDTVLNRRLQELRKQHSLSLQQLAGRSGLSIGTLSQVERGLSHPSLRTVRKLANAFGLPTSYFFDDAAATEADDGIVIRDGQGAVMNFSDTNMTARLLSPQGLTGMQFMRVRLKPGAMSGKQKYRHTGLDVGFVMSGTLNLEVEDRFFVLGAGDSFCFDSQRDHRFENCGQVDSVIIYVNTQ